MTLQCQYLGSPASTPSGVLIFESWKKKPRFNVDEAGLLLMMLKISNFT